ncbi:hypothetical protein BAY61_01160 [Prauserella marina]|uniref:SseB protein N-terminal domain-containing protein n=1 Tax=Prauserella marina TaxID=530584 RepID=A0A222VIS5_9PSEU|nr:SseB family protein [Prauserella marina]ASR33825.1 hypothetical protein BAY61_01160 [Prauserella marina]PWV82407.1 type III secretion system (T3SS) SseB-like protein [Prauserella marina]SDC68428.1 SseB protein N-terminal domain-containing protein [Prauserella marina]
MWDALQKGDSQRFARLVIENRLYVPKLPERNSPDWWELSTALALEREHVFVFTSVASMDLVLGRFVRGYGTTDFATLLRQWRNPDWALAINPGLPIGLALPPAALPAVASGELSLKAISEVEEETSEFMEGEIRALCLEGLGVDQESASGPQSSAPVNALERELVAAVAQQDGGAFIDAVIGADVVVPTSRPVTDPVELDELTEEDFPWLKIEGGPVTAVPVFSSESLLDDIVTAPGDRPRVTIPFLSVLTRWPDETHVLCFNPGTDTELILFGDTVLELLAAVAEAIDDGSGSGGGQPY